MLYSEIPSAKSVGKYTISFIFSKLYCKKNEIILHSVGKPILGVIIQIRNKDNKKLKFNEIGEIWVKTDKVMKNEEKTRNQSTYVVHVNTDYK